MRIKMILFFLLVFLLFIGGFRIYHRSVCFARNWERKVNRVSPDSVFELRKGDILIRPNWSWLPGSIPIPDGRKYGHVAVVVEGATGATADEVLKKTKVVEALFFDQKTKQFLMNKSDQIREESAWTSFGPKFKGIRYRLRIPLTQGQTDTLCHFLQLQGDSRYNILSLKQNIFVKDKRIDRPSWHCATLTWKAFLIAARINIDSNDGILIYPSDIIFSPYFDGVNGRVRF